MNFRQTPSRRRDDVSLDLTPLIDVVFLLLIFFLITTTFVREDNQQLPLELPSAGAGEPVKDTKRVIVYVDPQGNLRINDEQIRKEETSNRLRTLFQEDPEIQLLVKGDKDASYGYVTHIIGTAKQIGFKRVNLVVKPQGQPAPTQK